MLPFTLDNNLIFKYDGCPFDWTSNGEFTCEYARASRQPSDFRDEVVHTARLLADSGTCRLLLSGGLDSEVVAKGFLEAGITCNPITFRFKHDLNSHEMHYVKQFSQRHGLDVEYVDIDIEDWINSKEAIDMMRVSACVYPEMSPHMKLMSMVANDGCIPVLGNGDLYVRKDINPQWRMNKVGTKYTWNYVEYEYILAWFRYAIAKQIVGGIAFFQHTPEITLSMLNEHLIDQCFRSSRKMSTRFTKYEVYRRYWPDLEERPKFNGGEKVRSVFSDAKRGLKNMNRLFNREWRMNVHEFKRMIQHDPTSYS